jgi:capsule polysaccharide export protein KpsE/RkpR
MKASLDLSFLRPPAVRKRIAAITVAFAILGVAYAFLAPRWYRSVLTVVPAKAQRGGGLSSMLGGELGGMAAGFLDSAGGAADAARIAAVLESIAVTDAAIEKFDLRSRYREKYLETTREELWRHCSVKTLQKPQLVELSCEDKDPQFVQELLGFFAQNGNKVFRRVNVSSASEEVRFLETRVGELRQLADESAAKVREFEEAHRIVDLDTQAKAVVSSMAALNAQRIGKQLELGYARTYSGQDEPSLQQLRSQLSVMSDELRDLEEPAEAAAASDKPAARARGPRGMFPAALEVPKLKAEFQSLFRNRRVAEATLVFALERLEAARANEARESSTFLVLDPPALPTKAARPKRLVVIAISVVLGLAFALGYELWRAGLLPVILAAALEKGRDPEPVTKPPRAA